MAGSAETCDEGSLDLTGTGAGCNSLCTGTEVGWFCSGGGPSVEDLCNPICGDGLILGVENCDDHSNDGLGCAPGCQSLNTLGYDCTLNHPNGTTKCTNICGDGY